MNAAHRQPTVEELLEQESTRTLLKHYRRQMDLDACNAASLDVVIAIAHRQNDAIVQKQEYTAIVLHLLRLGHLAQGMFIGSMLRGAVNIRSTSE